MSAQLQISFIIPAYNVENYIGATLESILSIKDLSFEIIVVDDNSTDNTKEVILAYVKKYPFIKLYTNERTKGVSGARNTALMHMQGKTCFFLDADDLIISSSINSLFDCMEKHDSPIVRGNLLMLCYQRWLVYNFPTFIPKDTNQYPHGHFAQHLYDSEFLKNNSIFFPEDCSMGEDLTFFCKVFCLAKLSNTIPSISDYIYVYRINHKENNPRVNHALSFMKHFTYIRQHLDAHNKLHFFPSYMQTQFPHRWLDLAYYAHKDSQESIEKYLADCAQMLSGKEVELAPILKPELREQSKAFWEACNTGNTHDMLLAIQKTNLVQPVSPYMGIKKHQIKSPFWKFIRILHRVKSILNNPKSLSSFLYVYRLEKKSKKFLKHVTQQ